MHAADAGEKQGANKIKCSGAPERSKQSDTKRGSARLEPWLRVTKKEVKIHQGGGAKREADRLKYH